MANFSPSDAEEMNIMGRSRTGETEQARSAQRDGTEEEAQGGIQGRMSRWVQGKEGTRAQLDQCNPVCLIMTASESECLCTIWKSIGVARSHHQWATLLDAHTQETKYIKRKTSAAVILRPPCF